MSGAVGDGAVPTALSGHCRSKPVGRHELFLDSSLRWNDNSLTFGLSRDFLIRHKAEIRNSKPQIRTIDHVRLQRAQ
jgi:hypothetical protein